MTTIAPDQIPARPFIEWIEQQLDAISRNDTLRLTEVENHVPATRVLADRLGVEVRILYRYRRGLRSGSRNGRKGEFPTDTFPRAAIEDMLDHAEVPFWEVYPDLDDDLALETDAFCPSCHEIVTPILGQCPWCDTAVETELPRRQYCEREDAMRFPALDGNCWRCGGRLQGSVPWAPCACGCGQPVRRFDRYGREARYLVGHGPSPARSAIVDAEPFAGWLEQQLRELDPIQALARRIGINRDRLLALLNRHESQVDLAEVRRSLWLAAREGQGKGTPPRPGSTLLADLYPDYVRSKVCPECGGGKAPHAQLCRQCRRKNPTQTTQPRQPSSVTEDLIFEAKRLYDDGHSMLAAARAIQPRTRCTNPHSVCHQLRAEFHRRGWPIRRSPIEGSVAA
jgi:hypothetical protein